ncbi:hypothetical protein SASPL_139267 [Salvia splendens]|uniref:Uncharacterized protein n=1 Tax=Salvia splendens TaxID=180675 RepID=A0A8X8WNQ3_SALSN|nr:hypothetical protein SASPL_139267 [Salvia splendens]
MEAALDSPLEALAFNYLSYALLTAVNNIWAWLAVSFWRIRVLSTPIAVVAVPERVEEIAAAEEAAPARAAPCVAAEGQGITKMKFSLWQDRTLLSGNVVRLWEGRRRRRHAAAEAVDDGFAW